MNSAVPEGADVMQVCRNGHVITERLRRFPEQGRSHCDRCGATTMVSCPTCGVELGGALPAPGLEPVGSRPPPQFCAACGSAFPWTTRPCTRSPLDPLVVLDHFFRRLPRTVRQLRNRRDGRPPFRVEDQGDLEDLLRALLPLYFDDVRPQSRTPSYSLGTRTDFWLSGERIAITVKKCGHDLNEMQLAECLDEDVAYYQNRSGIKALAGLIFDPEGRLPTPRRLEEVWSRTMGVLEVRWVIAGY